jgi:hypothetical protein
VSPLFAADLMGVASALIVTAVTILCTMKEMSTRLS